MAFLSFGYRISSEANLFVQPLGPVTEGVFRVLFAGWTSYIFGRHTVHSLDKSRKLSKMKANKCYGTY
jgi:hypothetical protein